MKVVDIDHTDLENIKALVENHHSKGAAVFAELRDEDGKVWHLTGSKLMNIVQLVTAQHQVICELVEKSEELIRKNSRRHHVPMTLGERARRKGAQ